MDTVEDVLTDPNVDQPKKGDLAGFRVHKFSMGRQSILLAYRVENDSLVFYQVGTHENFCQDLKTYIKEIGG